LAPTRQVGGGGGAVVVVVGGSVVVGGRVDGGTVAVEVGASLASREVDAHPTESASRTTSPSTPLERDVTATMNPEGYGGATTDAGRATDYTREMELPSINRQVVLKQRPEGLVQDRDVELVERPMPELADGDALMRNVYLGMDATVRTWLNRGEGYLPAVEIGEVVRCSSVGQIVSTRCDAYEVGDIVISLGNWQEYAVVRDDLYTTLLDRDASMLSMMSVFGSTGAAAYFGLLDVGRPEPGQTVVVSAAAGATGSLVGQIAKIKGCRVVGIAGTDEKCAWVVDELGFDGCINHRTDDITARLRELCPDRVDVYFDNVGGPILDAVLGGLAMHGRVVLCGAISVYNDQGRPPGPANYLNLIARRGRMEGFITLDHWDRFPECMAQLREWADEGRLTWREEIVQGLDQCAHALNMLFTGENTGKVVVQVAPDPTAS
jgi:NADPH-dependent curcumin reductase CurA